jgi:hypothetical protein
MLYNVPVSQRKEARMKPKKLAKQVEPEEKYLVINEDDQEIYEWCDSHEEAKSCAVSFVKINSKDALILKIASAERVRHPEEPEPEVVPIDLKEL